jgi:hypothetical protein
MLCYAMDENPSRQEQVAKLRRRIEQTEAKIIAQNEVIAVLELSGRDAREARAIRAQLWVSQETDRAELEQLTGENDKP